MQPYLNLKSVVSSWPHLSLSKALIGTPILGHNIGRRKIQNGLFYTDPHSVTDA